jgi:outer membrane protein OmpA-like peptidoglycan-associated protein
LQFSGIDEKLARNLYNIGKSSVIDVANLRFTDNRFTVMFNAWNESGVSGAFTIVDTKEKMLRAGVTVKSLNGLGAAYIINKGTTFTFYQQNNSKLDSTLYANYDLEIGFTNEFSYAENPPTPAQLDTFTQTHNDISAGLIVDNVLKKQKRLGKGYGFDIGFVYEKRTGKKTSYKYRAAASIVDIGAINYYNTQFTYVTHYKAESEVTIDKGPRGNNTRQYDTSIAARLGQTPGTFQAFKMGLPTSLNLSFDYRLINHVYLNGTIIQGIRGKYTRGIRTFSSMSVTPRFESRWFSAALPVVLNGDYKNLNLGLCVSVLNCIYIGSDNLGGAFGIGTIKGLDVYAGAAINIYKHKKKKKEPGAVTTKARDTDKDGVLDDADSCVDIPGLPSMKGCPDKDGDGFADKEDQCVDVPGTVRGCPDSDNDGVADKDDKCPTAAGSAATKGCPDRDGDGITDLDDECPDVKGPVIFKGCPDSDADGFPDKDDDCPLIPGKIKGCPDKDGDGVVDKSDKCPDVPGTLELKGCPDADGDGVNDADDQCPLVAGLATNFGCPAKEKDVVKVEKVDLNEEDKKTMEEAFKNLEFATGKSEIKPESTPDLDKIVDILQRNPTYRLLIVGHTDNAGSAALNKTLSQNRANAVQNYMVSKGIPANRFITKGYGPDRPIADNTTEEGKQKNRRVEMTIVK